MPQELDVTSRPLAAEGYESYRCKGGYDWIMIGANSDDEALSEARRSTANPPLADIDRWDGATYVPCQGAERNAAMEAQMSRSRSLLAQQSGCLAIYGKNLSPSLNACRLKGGSGLAAQ